MTPSVSAQCAQQAPWPPLCAPPLPSVPHPAPRLSPTLPSRWPLLCPLALTLPLHYSIPSQDVTKFGFPKDMVGSLDYVAPEVSLVLLNYDLNGLW